MEPLRPIPEFLCYKYKGVRRADQILAKATPFAWKCRKYQNWKEIQNVNDDKQLLCRVADALLDGGKLPMADFGRLSAIWYNVQRWRKDKQQLADEPEHDPAWDELDCLLRIVSGNPRVAIQKLDRELPKLETTPLEFIWELFYGWALHNMFDTQKAPNLPSITFTSLADKVTLDAHIAALVDYVYTSVGLKCPTSGKPATSRSLIVKVCADLGLVDPNFDYQFEKEDIISGQPAKTLVVQYANLGPIEVIKSTEIDGHINLKINDQHNMVIAARANETTKALLEEFLSAYAEAAQQLPTHKDTLNTLTSYLGIQLKRRAARKRQ